MRRPRRCPAANDEDSQGNEYTEKLGNFFDGGIRRAKKFVGLGKAPAPPPLAAPSGCPEITVLDGTGAQRVMANAAAGNAGLRHQFSITEVARECQLSGARMVVKVGVEGRVLLGPAGTPGTFGVPVRVAIVDRMSEKPFLSKLFKVAATIPAGQSTTDYSLVADSLVVPFAAGRTAQDYSIKIGIDSAGGGEVAAKAPRRHHKAKAVAQRATMPAPRLSRVRGARSRAGHALVRWGLLDSRGRARLFERDHAPGHARSRSLPAGRWAWRATRERHPSRG